MKLHFFMQPMQHAFFFPRAKVSLFKNVICKQCCFGYLESTCVQIRAFTTYPHTIQQSCSDPAPTCHSTISHGSLCTFRNIPTLQPLGHSSSSIPKTTCAKGGMAEAINLKHSILNCTSLRSSCTSEKAPPHFISYPDFTFTSLLLCASLLVRKISTEILETLPDTFKLYIGHFTLSH